MWEFADRAPFVGRGRELDAILGRLDAARAGTGGVVVIGGEAGIGKSRLVAEVRARAAAQGFSILQGCCFPPDRSLPYAPLLDLLRATFVGRHGGDLAAMLGPIAPELTLLVPELGVRLPGVTPPVAVDPEQDKRRIFQALAEFLVHQAAARPALVVLEDLHWSDDTSIEFLQTLVRRVADQPLLTLLTYRNDEPHPTLGAVVGQLTGARLATELSLAPLSFADVERLLRSLLGDDQPAKVDMLDRIYSLTDGNPFFVEEVAKTLSAAGDSSPHPAGTRQHPNVPPSVQDAVQRRIAGLSGDARDLLTFAAVAGQRVDFDLLQDTSGKDERELLVLIRELISAHLVVEESADRFAFRHALTRQAVLAGLLGRERRALHARIVEAIERRHGTASEAWLPDLAYHCYEAGIWAKALEYARRVGERAQAMYTPRAAVEQFGRALEAAKALGQPAPQSLLRARGQAHETIGDFDAARIDFEAALDAARTAGDRHDEWQALLDLGFLWAGRDYGRVGGYFRRSLDLARALDDSRAVAQSLNRLGNWFANNQQPEESFRLHEEALEILRRLGDERGVAETLDLLGMASFQHGDLLRAADLFQQAIALFETQDNRHGLASSLTVWTYCAGAYAGDVDVWETVDPMVQERRIERGLRIAREIDWRAGEAFALFVQAECIGSRGHYSRALDLAHEALRVAEAIEHQQWMAGTLTVLGDLYLDLLIVEKAQPYLERALTLAHEIGSQIWTYHAAARLAHACLQRHDGRQAEALLAAALDSHPPARTTARRLAELVRAEASLARHDSRTALDQVEAIIAATPNAGAGPGRVAPRPWMLRAGALLAEGRVDEAASMLDEAQASALDHELPGVLWRIHAARAGLERRRRRSDAAAHELAEAERIIDDIAGRLPEVSLPELGGRSIGSVFAERAREQLPRLRPPTTARAEKASFAGLTAREREIAALVAGGRSNRDIAGILVLAERTIETHLSNIFAKLGYSSRAQLAAWAVEQGLSQPE